VLAENTTSLQVEAPHGKRSKVKSSAVLLRFESPAHTAFMAEAQREAEAIDVDFLWQCCGVDEFGYDGLATEYYGHAPSPVEAASLRLRPILMTTGAMVLGALPLALASGAGAESRQQIGWVIVGGMSFGTLLTIFVVPTVYTLFARRKVPGEITTPDADGPPAGGGTHGQPTAVGAD
jgi:hypothetical protein